MISLQSDNNIVLSLIITAIVIVVIGSIYVLIRQRDHLMQITSIIQRYLGKPVGVAIFTAARILVGLIGVCVLLATVLPGLMPFREYMNQNLELGGLLFFFIWPIILVQITTAFMPYPRKWIEANPLVAWIILLTVGCLSAGVDSVAMTLMYDFSSH